MHGMWRYAIAVLSDERIVTYGPFVFKFQSLLIVSVNVLFFPYECYFVSI